MGDLRAAGDQESAIRIRAAFSGAGVKFVFEQAAFDVGVEEGDSSAGSEVNFFGEVGVAGEEVAGVAGAFLFEKVSDAFVSFFQVFDFAQAGAVFRVHQDNAFFAGSVDFQGI